MVRRDPDATRQRILESAGNEIHRQGFRNASLDQILSDTGLTKGALYHHFPNKAVLGHAVVDEVIRDQILDRWVRPMEEADNPLDGLRDVLTSMPREDVEQVCSCGCPLNNLAQEMSAVDETFRQKLAAVYRLLTDRMAGALLRGQESGHLSPDVDCRKAAVFIAAALEGSAGAAKNARDPRVLEACRDGAPALSGVAPRVGGSPRVLTCPRTRWNSSARDIVTSINIPTSMNVKVACGRAHPFVSR